MAVTLTRARPPAPMRRLLEWAVPAFLWSAVALAMAVAAAFLCLHGDEIASRIGVPSNTLTQADNWGKVLTFAVGAPAAIFALFSYARAQVETHRTNLWKRKEFVALRFDRIEGSENCRTAMRLLDYNATRVRLAGISPEVRLNDLAVMSALAPRPLRGTYTPHEQLLREAFDEFFNELDRLAVMVEADLIEPEDLKAYAGYWLGLFNPTARDRPAAYGAILRRYVRVFSFSALERLLATRNLAFPGDKTRADDDDRQILIFGQGRGVQWAAPPPGTAWEELMEASA